ncbi:putative mitochondrial protein [Cucumis melo var. makuwa]|uniref:Mitochondrial protein n=1 Tax=Cucumis melo var. makuwa TaxID=1194695 RepID=A0A5D3BNC1_CUCMM|nr:putative mitochondrial protein [Cucumis melo var. makuwa]TYK00754.1 putative mitochondrial protein [Cucumis melo var. makuwa]
MGDEFEIKNLENLKYFLGMEVVRSKEGIFVSQRKYTLYLLTETGILRCYPVDTPIELNYKLRNSYDKVPVDKEQYQSLEVISITNNLVQHDRTKHVEIDQHFIKERLDNGSICISYISSSQQAANVLTRDFSERNLTFMCCSSRQGVQEFETSFLSSSLNAAPCGGVPRGVKASLHPSPRLPNLPTWRIAFRASFP